MDEDQVVEENTEKTTPEGATMEDVGEEVATEEVLQSEDAAPEEVEASDGGVTSEVAPEEAEVVPEEAKVDSEDAGVEVDGGSGEAEVTEE